MFGGQDNTATMPQNSVNASQDDTLRGVTNLVGGTAPATGANGQDSSFPPRPSDSGSSDVSVGSAPALPDDAAQGSSSATAGNEELLGIKQQALQQLTPLVSHLDQTPLERFRTTMMLIQASDNQTLLKDAYEAAQKIEDDKIRAQALLDIINEINYFTQPKQ